MQFSSGDTSEPHCSGTYTPEFNPLSGQQLPDAFPAVAQQHNVSAAKEHNTPVHCYRTSEGTILERLCNLSQECRAKNANQCSMQATRCCTITHAR